MHTAGAKVSVLAWSAGVRRNRRVRKGAKSVAWFLVDWPRFVGYAYLPTSDRWRFTDHEGTEASIVPKGPMRANNAEALAPALRAGLGLAVQPDFMIWDDLKAGTLERVLPDWALPPIALHLVTPPGELRPARVTVLIAYLAQALSAAPWASADHR